MKINLEEIKKNKSMKELIEFGIINIDKSSGPTSFNISHFLKRNLKLSKTSHFGTLDPKVTGVLPVALGRACKLSGYFLGEDKEYVGIMSIHEEREMEEIQKVIDKKFTGVIKQTPPLKSRVKIQERERTIHEFKLLGKKDKNILFRVSCQGGTYIRKLLVDLGEEMKMGAHMLELRRIRAGIFLEDDAQYPCVRLYDFEKAVEEYHSGDEKKLRRMIIPGEIVSSVVAPVEIKKDNLVQILTGKPLAKIDLIKKGNHKKDEIICVFCENNFVGIYKIIGEEEIFAKSEFVMQPLTDEQKKK